MNKKYRYKLKNLDCANCAMKIENKLAENPNFNNVVVNFNTLNLSLHADNDYYNEINKIVKSLEPDVVLTDINDENEFKISKLDLFRIIIGIIIGISSLFFTENIKPFVYFLAYLTLLPPTFINAVKIFIKSKSVDENALVSIAVIGAFLIGEGFDGFLVIALYEIGKFLEDLAINKSKKSVKDLMNIKPSYANLKVNNDIIKKDPNEININDILIIKKGERIPLDGEVIKGTTYLDTSALTGESKHVKVTVSNKVLSGSINTGDVVEIKVTNLFVDSTVSKILDLVENATDKKAYTENFVAKLAKIYTPIVIGIAVLSAAIFPLFNFSINESIYKALSLLVIACPCAIAISVPLSYFSGIGVASKNGILIKGSNFLDNLRNITKIVFDKTGTLTSGKFEIKKVVSNSNYPENDILKIAAHGEIYSTHPIALSIIDACKDELNKELVSDYKELEGIGISYKYDKTDVFVGRGDVKNEVDTVVSVIVNKINIGYIVIGDSIKNEASTTISLLKKKNIESYLFTGDNKNIALHVGEKLGINNIKYEMLPTDKYDELNNLLNKQDVVAFVGDGINDAPVLAVSDIGISMGGVGSSSAIEASDIVIMNDDISKINKGIDISKKTTKIIKQNLVFAISIKLIFIVLNIIGISSMTFAILSDVGVTLITILNSFRIFRD